MLTSPQNVVVRLTNTRHADQLRFVTLAVSVLKQRFIASVSQNELVCYIRLFGL